MTSTPRPPSNVPTLTEIVEPVEPGHLLEDPEVDAGLQAQQWEANVHRRVDAMLDARIRSRLAPVLARLTDALIQEIREELLAEIHDIVALAMRDEDARHPGP
jgi:hypothetical protein